MDFLIDEFIKKYKSQEGIAGLSHDELETYIANEIINENGTVLITIPEAKYYNHNVREAIYRYRSKNKENYNQKCKDYYHKKMEDKFNESLKYPINLELSKWFLSNVSLNRSVNIEKYSGNSLAIECLEDFVFDINYDYSFYESMYQKTIKNYRYVIINGIIESVGEIHHLLFKANETKEPYVIFCFGIA